MSSRLFASTVAAASAFSLWRFSMNCSTERELVDGVRDVAFLHVRRDHDERNARSQPELIDVGGRHVIVEAAEIVPRQDDRGGRPVRAPA